jgi:peptidoglycan DL-endopeptidase CwlO
VRSHARVCAATALTATVVGVMAASPAQAAVAVSGGGAGGSGGPSLVRLEVYHWAMHQRGKPYIWGGTGPAGFDCSGLVYAAYRAEGIHLPRTTYEMLGSWHLVPIRKSQARAGDLAFFGTGHVELFAHGNWTFGAARPGTDIGFHRMNQWWHPTMYFRVRR